MKKQFFYLTLSVALAACDNNRNDTATYNENTTTGSATSTDGNAPRSGKSLNDMPGPIKVAFQNRFQTATVDEWERSTENNQEVYKVEFKQDNVEKAAWFDVNGNFLREEND